MWGAGRAVAGDGRRKGRVPVDRRFTILADITSQGSMSKVYRALDNLTGKSVCLKVQDKDKNEAAACRSHEGKPCEGFIAYSVAHPNVARTLEYGETTAGAHYMLLEFVDGVSLQHVRQSMRVSLRGKLKVLAQAADGFAAVHKAGFIHRDINPRNILINRENVVKIIDFGLAVPNTAEFRKPGNRTGALPYMAPELVKRESTDERLDVFAFGAVAYEFLTGVLPYGTGTSMAQALQRINADPADPAVANPDLPAPLCELLLKTLARCKDDRWPSMPTLGEALRAIPSTKAKAAG